jgi:hypothetical protein
MRRLRSKAQAATEYLIILAVVIIIALIVVGVLGGIPGIGTGARSRASASYWQTADIAIPSFAAFAASDDLNVSIRNNLRNRITLTSVSVGGGTQACSETSLAPGQTTKCSDDDGAVSCSGEGDAFSFSVSVSYTDTTTGGTHTFTGDGNQLDGRCAT